jgi:hypothetical protein
MVKYKLIFSLVDSVDSFEFFMSQVRVFKFHTGKLNKVFDESLQRFSELQQERLILPNMEFGRR